MEKAYRMLIVDDEEKIRELIKKYALFEGYEVEESGDGMDAVEKCRKNNYDIIIMDIMMPFLDGFSACKEIRKTKNIPVIMLSARGEEYDHIHGFEVGVDDYVDKPFSAKELMMRVSAVIKRTARHEEKQEREVLTFEGLTVDFTGRLVYIDGQKIDMTPKEYELFFYLVKNRGFVHYSVRAFITEEIKRRGLDAVWLKKQIRDQGYKSEKEIFLAICDKNNKLYVFAVD